MLLVHGAQGEQVDANRRALEMLGASPSTADELGTGLVAPDGNAVVGEALPGARALRGERIDWAQYALRRPGRPDLPVALGASPVLDDRGRVQGAVVVLQDVTSAKELERLRVEWNSVIAHDLRQPLGAILLGAQLLASQAGLPPNARTLDRIISSVARLKRMIDDLLDLSLLDAQQLTLVRRTVDLVELVQACLDRLELASKTRRFELRVSGAHPVIDADPDRLSQVLDNLLSNAEKYSTPGTMIRVAVVTSPEQVSVAVTNEGEGIAPEELPSLFQRFHRLERARRGAAKGIGLGLYITHALIEAHGGKIEVESAPGATTTFRFILPGGGTRA
jgi:signal transduction histidine kinase